MSTKLRGLLVFCGVLLGGILFAQEKTVTGTVTDANGFSLSDVSVRSSSGEEVFTDMDGNYSIQANVGDRLTIESLGMEVVTVVVGASNAYNATLRDSGTIELEGAVVTALGITREKKSLGYASQEVSGETLSAIPVANFADALSGEVAGLDISSSGMRGGSSNMVIRGYSSLVGSNQPLLVIDGVPITNGTFNGGNQQTGRGGYDYANAASDINPNDIENINVLKGAAATALYGSRGMNGVIMITTKKGSKRKKGIGVEINSSIMVGSVDKETLPKYQKKYGGGYEANGNSSINEYFNGADINGDGIEDLYVMFGDDASYGAEFDPSLMVYQWNAFWEGLPTYGQATPWVAGKNDPNSIWKNTMSYSNSVAFSGNNENGSFRVGLTNYIDDGGIVNYYSKRNNIDISASYKLSDKLTVGTKFLYTDGSTKGRVGSGYDGLNPMQQFRQWWQVNVDMKELEQAYFITKRNATWNISDYDDLSPLYSDNFYWTRYENYQNDSRDRFTGNINVNYQFNSWLSVMGRFGFDNYTETREERLAVGTAGSLGEYNIEKINASENNFDLIVAINKNLTDDINLDANIGWNLRVENLDRMDMTTNGGLKIPGWYALDNSINPLTPGDIIQERYKKMNDGEFARLSLGFWNTIYTEGTIRTDRSSSLWSQAPNGSRYWYPSASLSFVFSELMNTSFVNFGKARVNYAWVGNDAFPYALWNTYAVGASFDGAATASNPALFKNKLLEPEKMEELEVGLEMAFWKNRVSFDVSYYDRKTYDLITPIDVSGFSGTTAQWLNAGDVQNKGIEARLTLEPIRSNDFTWRVNFNFAKNHNEVLALSDGIDFLNIARADTGAALGFQGGITIGAKVGEAYGIIRGTDYIYDASGNKVVDEDGYYLMSSATTVIGNMNPDWTGGVKNTFTYKNLALSFLIDISQGGDVFSLDTWYGYSTGLYDNFTSGLNDLGNPVRNSLEDGGGVILPGVKEDGTPNDIRIYAGSGNDNPWGYLTGPNKGHVYDASFVKLRNLTLSYDLPDRIIRNSFIEKFTISAIGRNLWIIHKNMPYSDPEAGLSAGNIRGYQSGAHPTYREIGASVKLTF